MPTYDYVCAACGHHFEHFQSMTSKKLRKCPECRKPRLERQVGSGAGVIFKGSGFYETDYKKKGSSDAASRGDKKPDAPKKEKKESAKADASSKPAKGADAKDDA